MEYEFIHDAITGEARARFSLEHEVMGPWLEVEVNNNPEKLTEFLTAINLVKNGERKEMQIVGSEYSVTLSRDEVDIQTNVSLNGSLENSEGLPEMLTDEHIHLDQNEMAGCGIDDFRALLLSWAKFSNIRY
ncbi:YacL family protein [Colwellia sp. D2M02]|uniref:UPF0231 family protein n=1 Tax=Colwellia sp. D2M02 TaxID=2841562 RepID=UPI001C08306A|nr:YacL family protein [Colwellia sp. D2M02]MBU2894326.1 YacL family protein [Colwellia sp. D2M02]